MSHATALNALANYFKHHDEWVEQVDWTKLPVQSLDTATIVMQLGLKPLSSGNLRAGSTALGNVDFKSVRIFEDAVADWARDVKTMVENALP